MSSGSPTAEATPVEAWTPAERAFAWSIFPVVIVGAIGGCIALIDRGVSPFVALAMTQAPAFLVVILGERGVPHVPLWNRSQRDIPTDLAHSTTVLITGVALLPLTNAVGAALGSGLAQIVGLGLWPSTWPLVAQLALALVLGEFFQYWVHRLEHEIPLLWRFHATHHSAPRLYWLNAGRFHFVDIGLNTIALNIPLVALGAGPEIFALWNLFSAVHGIFQHGNLKLRLGPLNWIFSMAELHRWHHSRLLEESNTNYGQNLALWDVVFGTRYLPSDREPPADIGLTGPVAFPMTFWAQVMAPLRWKQIEEASDTSETG